MDLKVLEFSRFEVYLFLFIAIAIFFLFRILKRLVPVALSGKSYQREVLRFLPLTEIFVWLLYFIWAIQFFWKNNQLYAIELSLAMTIILLWICWYALRDYIAGAIFKAGKNFNVNESIIIENISGKLTQLKSRYLVLETDNGESVYYPYSQITGKMIIKIHPAETILAYTFRIQYPEGQQPVNIASEIKKFILNLPWSSVKKEPQIKTSEGKEGQNPYSDITVYALEKEYFRNIEKHVREKFGAKYRD